MQHRFGPRKRFYRYECGLIGETSIGFTEEKDAMNEKNDVGDVIRNWTEIQGHLPSTRTEQTQIP